MAAAPICWLRPSNFRLNRLKRGPRAPRKIAMASASWARTRDASRYFSSSRSSVEDRISEEISACFPSSKTARLRARPSLTTTAAIKATMANAPASHANRTGIGFLTTRFPSPHPTKTGGKPHKAPLYHAKSRTFIRYSRAKPLSFRPIAGAQAKFVIWA